MTFNDIKAKTYFLTKTNSSSFPIANMVIEANNAVERVASLSGAPMVAGNGTMKISQTYR